MIEKYTGPWQLLQATSHYDYVALNIKRKKRKIYTFEKINTKFRYTEKKAGVFQNEEKTIKSTIQG